MTTHSIEKASILGINCALPSRGVMRPRADRPRRFGIESKITVAEAGTGPYTFTKTMKTAQFSLTSRKQLIDLLNDRYDGLRYKAKARYAVTFDRLERKFMDEIAQEQAVAKLGDELFALRNDLEAKTLALHAKGFVPDGNRLIVRSGAPDSLHEIIQKQVEEEIGTRGDIDRRFDDAQSTILTIETLEDAQQLIKSLLIIQ